MKTIYRSLLLAVMCVLASVCLVLAAEAPAAGNVVGDAFAGLLHGNIRPILESFIVAMIGLVLGKVRQKYGLQISAERQTQLEGLAKQGIGIAEEKAAAYLKANMTKMTGKAKLDAALAHVIARLPSVSIEEADAIVHYMLACTTGVGATGDQTV